MVTLKNEICPMCHEKKLTLTEEDMDIPYFGKTYIYSMKCEGCHYFKGDVEAAERKEPCKITFTIESEKDMKVRIVKSAEASINIPQLKMSVTPGPSSIGYVSNIEGVLDRFVEIIEWERDAADDEEEEDVKKRAKVILKKIRKVKWGDMPLKIIIEDPSGNSAIISEKTEITALKKSRKAE